MAKLWRAVRMLGLYRDWRVAFRNRLARRTKGGRVLYRLRCGARFSMEAGPHDVRVLNEVWLDRIYEPTAEFRVRDGWTVVDLGAHKGSFTVLAALSGPRTVVHAMEPAPDNLECLHRNIELNRATNVRVYERAVSSREGKSLIAVDSAASGRSSLIIERGFADLVAVRTMRLEDLLTQIPGSIDLLKIDVEGAERDVFRHASAETFSRVRRIVLEYHEIPGRSADEVAGDLRALLFQRGFRCGEVRNRHLLFAERADHR